MKAESIMKIETILKQKKESAHFSYNNIRYNIEQKHGKEWTNEDLTTPEKNMLYGQKKICNEMDDLYEDFMNHQW